MFELIPFNPTAYSRRLKKVVPILMRVDGSQPIVTVTGRADVMKRRFNLRDCLYLESDGLIRAEVAHDPIDMREVVNKAFRKVRGL